MNIIIEMVLLLMVNAGAIILIAQSYLNIRHSRQALMMNYKMIKRQYTFMMGLYSDRQRQLHDIKHQNILLLGYLSNGESDRALNYLNELMNRQNQLLKNVYTGIEVIDIVLSYMLAEASKSGIKIALNLDVLFCPVERVDMCILLGNLVDNAIESVMKASDKERVIYITMRTMNNIFLLEIGNPYTGKRKYINGVYQTTKKQSMLHGLGLESVKRIVHSYDGDLDIEDNGQFFKVCVTIFKNRINNAE